MDEYLLDSSLGLHLKSSQEALVEISSLEEERKQNSQSPTSGLIRRAIEQLNEYKDRLLICFGANLLNSESLPTTKRPITPKKLKKVSKKIFPNKYLTMHSFRKSFTMYLIGREKLHPKAVS